MDKTNQNRRRLLGLFSKGLATGISAAVLGNLTREAAAAETIDERFVAAAKKEGKVMFYTTVPIDGNVGVVEAFKKKYGIEAEYYRQAAVRMQERVEAEIKSNQLLADVLAIDIPLSEDLAKKGVFVPVEAPGRKEIAARWKTPELTAIRLYVSSILWNTNLIKPGDEPKGWEDLANPKYKGKLAVGDFAGSLTTIQWMYMVKKLYGVDYLKRFGQNRPRLFQSPSAIAPLVSAGEVPMSVSLEYLLPQQRAKGAPVDGFIGRPAFYGGIHVGVMARAPRPNAARLFHSFVVSREGQEALCGPLKSIATNPKAEIPGAYKLSDVKEWFELDYTEMYAQVEQLRNDFNTYIKGSL